MDVIEGTIVLQFEYAGKFYLDAKFRKVEALRDITLSVARGEFISFIGPSGCGKSTLLRLAAGLEMATTGAVLDRGKAVSGPDPERGFVFQSYNAFPWLTVRKNISFGLDSESAQEQEKKVSKWLNSTGLVEFADSYPKALSGGMRQRLALARTMIVEPQLLLLDEPFGALDERIRETMQQLLLRVVRDSGCTVLFVTHDIREAILLSDRIFMLSARPGTILREFVPSLSKPRAREHLRTQEFNSLYEAIVDNFPISAQPETQRRK
jgi:NitT/TauT family transport system ATP-binding protein